MPHRQLLSAVAIALTNLLFMPVMAAWQVTANSNSASLSANTSHPTFREQIVFVRANPSLGVSSVVSITDVNGKTGDTTGRHDAPQFQATASANFKRNEIALMNPDGSDWRVLHVYGSDPALSPDGTKIAYCSVRESIYSQVYVMNIDGTAQKTYQDRYGRFLRPRVVTRREKNRLLCDRADESKSQPGNLADECRWI